MKQKLLFLLVLLLTATTGAWGMQIYISYPSWPTGTNVNGDGNLVLEMEASDSFENMKAKIEDKSGLNPDYMKLYFNSVEMANNETLNTKGVTSNSVLTLVYTLYSVSMKDGVKDADKWTVKVGEGEAQALPIGGLKGDGTETVTLTYSGRLKVKGVKATSDAAPAATLQSITVGKGSTELSSDKIFYYMPGDTYRQALDRTENQTAGDLGWGYWESSDLTTLFFKEVSTKAWDMAIDGDSNFASGQGSSTITLDTVIDTTNHTFQFVNSQ